MKKTTLNAKKTLAFAQKVLHIFWPDKKDKAYKDFKEIDSLINKANKENLESTLEDIEYFLNVCYPDDLGPKNKKLKKWKELQDEVKTLLKSF